MKNDQENNEHFDKLFAAKEKLRVDLDIQNFKNQCFSVNDFLKLTWINSETLRIEG